jgi:hypothetical protein
LQVCGDFPARASFRRAGNALTFTKLIRSPDSIAMASPAVVLVGADKGGVGKTTVARTLLDYLSIRKIPARAFDTETPRGTLKRFHPAITEVVDITRVGDQMRIFDTLSDAQVTVIDVRAGMLSTTLQALHEIGFTDAARRGQINFILLHILGPSISSLEEIARTAEQVAGTRYALVKNFINNTSFFEWDEATYNGYFRRIEKASEITVPKLNEMAAEQVDLAAVSYLSYVASKGARGEAASYSFVLRGYVRHWLGQVWAEYDRIKLPEALSPREVVQLKARAAG